MENMIRQLLVAAEPGLKLPAATVVDDTTPTVDYLTPETYLGGKLEQTFSGPAPLVAGRNTYRYPAAIPNNEYALSGEWFTSDESATAGRAAEVRLEYFAADVYLDVGGTGTITATVAGRVTKYEVSGAPNIYQLVSGDTPGRGTLEVTLSQGLTAYSFTFG
jgi:hypothetical protein